MNIGISKGHSTIMQDITNHFSLNSSNLYINNLENRYQNRYIVVAMNYFSRWPEAKPLKVANADIVSTFLYEEIICRFETSRILQSDRGTHFVNEVI